LKNKEGNTTYMKKEEASAVDMLGAEFANVSPQEKKELGLQGGVKVTKLNDGTLSRSTNMKEGFIITKLNNKPVNNIDELKEALSTAKGSGNGVMIEGRYPDYPGQYFYAFGL
jgi:S1-C subfamily serine protease